MMVNQTALQKPGFGCLRKFSSAVAVALFLFRPCLAQSHFELNRITGPISLDGRSDEAAWETVAPLPLIMYQPTHGGSLTERTEIRIAYDDHYLYASGRFYDTDPGGVRVNSLYRDRTRNDDTFDLIIDSFNDKENGLWFRTNPAGIRVDMAVSGDGRGLNADWDTFWDAEAVQTEEGWFAELRIPFSSLGFQKKQDQVVVGLIAFRFISRKNERHLFPAIPNEWPYQTISQAREVILNGIRIQRPVYLTPYTLGGFGQIANLNQAGSGFQMDSQWEKDIGLDIKYNITSNLTLDVTLNTDFAQVEADDQMVNLTRFSLFFPEKRRFFQERAGIFSFGTTVWTNTQVFHSRRIGIHEGQEVPILGGARLIGRVGNWDIGCLDMQTREMKDLDLSSENFGVLRVRRRIINPYSYAGCILTSRMGVDGSYNHTYGADATFRMTEREYVIVRWAQSIDSELLKQKRYDFRDSGSGFFALQRRSQEGLDFMASASYMGRDFTPEMGFTTLQNFTEFAWSVSYDWFPGEDSPFRRVSPIQCFGFAALRNEDRTLESAQLEYDTDLYWKSGSSIWLDGEVYYENLQTAIPFPDNTEIPEGSYTFFKVEGGYNMAGGNLFRSYISGGYGGFYDGTRMEAGVTSVWNASRHLELLLQYSLNRVHFSSRNQEFNAHILRLRVQSAINSRFSIHAFLQYNSIADIFASNIRMRYNFSEGHDLWLVYNEALNTDRDRFEIIPPLTSNRTVLAKYTYTIGI